MSHLIKVEKLNVKYNERYALKDVSFTIKKSKGVIGLIGPNGSGKTTLIKSILNLTKITSGSINCQTSKISYCPDTPSFEPYLSAVEVLDQTAKLSNVDHVNISDLVSLVGLTGKERTLTGGYSRGMLQRLGIAVSLVPQPDLIFLDEPTSALDAFGRRAVLEIIEEVSKTRLVIVSSHALTDIQKIAQDLIVLNNSQLIYEGGMGEFIKADSIDQIDFTFLSDKAASDFKNKLSDLSVNATTSPHQANQLTISVADGRVGLELASRYFDTITKITYSQYDLYDAFYQRVQDKNQEGSND